MKQSRIAVALAAAVVVGMGLWTESSARGAAGSEGTDVTLDTAERFLGRAMSEAKETAISSTRDTSQIISALRSARDKGLLPLFQALRTSTVVENQVYGMVAAAILAKDPNAVDVKLLLGARDPALVGSAIATLIDAGVMPDDDLQQIVATASDPAQKAMAAGELNHRGKLKDRSILMGLLNSDKDVVRYYAAISLLESTSVASTQPNAGGAGGVNSEESAAALAALNQMSAAHDLRQAPVQALMIVRSQKQKITAAGPWITAVARDDKNDEGLRYTALSALLALKNPNGPPMLTDLLQTDREIAQQVKLGLIAVEYADRLSPGALEPLVKSRSSLAKAIGTLAQQEASAPGTDITPGLLKLIRDGQPIMLNWALDYSDRADPDRRLALRAAIINAATIVDDNRGQDYERAAAAAQKAVEDSAAGQRLVGSLLNSENKAVVEACLAGIYRSEMKDQSSLVMPLYGKFTTTPHTETIANYAALILAREGHTEALSWLPNMVIGSTVQNPGFRALAGWYYAKLKGEQAEYLKAALSS